MAKKPSAKDDLWALYQTRTVSQIAKALKVDRRTVQRIKNGEQKPNEKNAARISRLAASDRRQFREYATRKDQHYKPPKVAVPLVGRRQYVTEEIKPSRKQKENREAWEKSKARSKELGRQFDRFYARKDKKTGKTKYFRAQDAGAVVFDLRRARLQDVLRLIQSFQGEGRAMVLVHQLTKAYPLKGGPSLPKGTHLGSKPELMDQGRFSDEAGILDWLTERLKKGKPVHLRVTEPSKN